MLKIFYGDDRIKIAAEVKKTLGDSYEVLEGAELAPESLPSVFLGISLFSSKRKILIKDLGENKPAFEKLVDYINTEHDVIIWETKLDKRTVTYKNLQKAKVEMKEFKTLAAPETKLVFDIYDTALRDGKKAVMMVEKIEETQDPYMFFGLLVSQALKKYEWARGAKEKRVLKELSKLDMQMKSTSIQPWTLVKSFLLQVSSL